MPKPTKPGLYWFRSYNYYAVVAVSYPESRELWFRNPEHTYMIYVHETYENQWGECHQLPQEMWSCISLVDRQE